MKPLRCKACWTSYSGELKECPQCHAPPPKRLRRSPWVLAGGALVGVVALVSTAWLVTDPGRLLAHNPARAIR